MICATDGRLPFSDSSSSTDLQIFPKDKDTTFSVAQLTSSPIPSGLCLSRPRARPYVCLPFPFLSGIWRPIAQSVIVKSIGKNTAVVIQGQTRIYGPPKAA